MADTVDSNNSHHMLDLYDRVTNLWKFFRRHYWVLLLAGFLGGIIGVLYAHFQPPKFQSSLTFALEDNGGNMGSALSLAAEFGFNLGSSGKDVFAGENILAILTSRRLVEGVLLTADTVNGRLITLADQYLKITRKEKALTNHTRLGTIRFPANLARVNFSYFQDSILFTLYTAITKTELSATKPDRKLNIYKVEFTNADQRFAKTFTERLVEQANIFYTDLRSKRSLQTLQVLEGRVAAMEGTAKSAIRGRAGIEDANLNPVYASQNALLQSKSLDITAYGSAYGELFKNLELARYQYLKEMPLMQVIDEPHYPMKNLKKGRLMTGIIGAIAAIFLGGICLMGYYFLGLMSQNIEALKRSNLQLPAS